jgi:hypothetical protein
MIYINYIQLLFALIAVMGMLYIELVNDRNKRHENNFKKLRDRLYAITNNTCNLEINNAVTFEQLKNIYQRYSKDSICEQEIKTNDNHHDDVTIQWRLFFFPLLMMCVLSVFVLWTPILKPMIKIMIKECPLVKSMFMPIIFSFAILFSLHNIYFIANYPYVGNCRKYIKWITFRVE